MAMPALNSFSYSQPRTLSRPPSRPMTPVGGTIPASALFGENEPQSNPSPAAAPPSSRSVSPATSVSLPQQSTLNKAYKPSKQVESDFNFAVPSLPPRLANFGRKISQMGSDFINELDAPYSEPVEGQGKPQRDEVPGMGDEPVMCPFCEKPLPPVLFAAHSHPPKTRRPATAGPGTLKRSNTITGAKPSPMPLKSLASMKAEAAASPKLMEPLKIEIPDPTMSAEALQGEVSSAEKANAAAAALTISSDDIRRWSKVAGVAPPAESSTSTSEKKDEKEIPKIAPPPGVRPISSRSSSNTSKQYGFFSKKDKQPKEDDEDESDDGAGGSGYARLQAGGSDTEEDDKESSMYDEPKPRASVETGAREETKVDKEDTTEVEEKEPDMSSDEIKLVLREILSKMTEMSNSHTALLTSQGTLLTSLKIARSNLAMAEANTEMLEAQLKTTPKAPSRTPSARYANDPTTPGSTARQPASAGVAGVRQSEERQRPMSMQIPSSSGRGADGQEKSGWGFWNNNGGKKRFPSGINVPSASQILDALPTTPSMEGRNFDLESGAPYSAAPTRDLKSPVGRVSSDGLHRSASYAGFPMSPPRQSSLPSAAAEHVPHPALEQLQKNYENAQNRMESMSKELAELKKGKLEMETELENLSQALFEEANKMVADERRKRSELEEALKEVKDEREALRQTIKVLGGQTEPSDDEKSEVSIKGEDDSVPADFMPRDLDKHYEALRKSIHHVADGATEHFSMLRANKSLADVQESIPETVHEEPPTSEDTEYDEETESDTSTSHKAAPEISPNPWANPAPFASGPTSSKTGTLPGEDKLNEKQEIDPTEVSNQTTWT